MTSILNQTSTDDMDRYRVCPRCHGSASRVHRRLIDRIISSVLMVGRYRCESRRCNWAGNLRPLPVIAVDAPLARIPGVAGKHGKQAGHIGVRRQQQSAATGSPHRNAGAPQPHDGVTRLLLVEHDPGFARVVRQTLVRTGSRAVQVDCVVDMGAALAHVAASATDVVLVEPSLCEEQGKDAFRQLLELAPQALVLLLSSASEADAARQAAGRGADGYIDKAHLDGHWVPRVLQILIERKLALLALGEEQALRVEDGQRAQLLLDAAKAASRLQAGALTLAQHDPLTGLPGRALLGERLQQAIAHAERQRKQLALLFVDLDHFKRVNDTLGHGVGDKLLRAVAERMQSCVRATDTVCRHGGDEFVILLSEIDSPQAAAQVAGKLLLASREPYRIDGHEFPATLSIGISVFPEDSREAGSMIRHADQAMYHAKGAGRDNCQFYHADMNALATRRTLIEAALRRALERGEFHLEYQPQIDLDSGTIIGAEALLRWRTPEHGLVHPAQFLPVAEQCGLMVPLGHWVLREACRQVREWIDAGLRAVPISVNVSLAEIREPGFLDNVKATLKETRLTPAWLELDVTEGILMHDAGCPVSTLEGLKALGVRLAVDDFGTGVSSLGCLHRFPVDTLKIHQSFVFNMPTDEADAAIVSAVIGLGRNLGRRVIAEGVETPLQLAFLRSQDCEAAQGYGLSHPVGAVEFAALLGQCTPTRLLRRPERAEPTQSRYTATASASQAPRSGVG